MFSLGIFAAQKFKNNGKSWKKKLEGLVLSLGCLLLTLGACHLVSALTAMLAPLAFVLILYLAYTTYSLAKSVCHTIKVNRSLDGNDPALSKVKEAVKSLVVAKPEKAIEIMHALDYVKSLLNNLDEPTKSKVIEDKSAHSETIEGKAAKDQSAISEAKEDETTKGKPKKAWLNLFSRNRKVKIQPIREEDKSLKTKLLERLYAMVIDDPKETKIKAQAMKDIDLSLREVSHSTKNKLYKPLMKLALTNPAKARYLAICVKKVDPILSGTDQSIQGKFFNFIFTQHNSTNEMQLAENLAHAESLMKEVRPSTKKKFHDHIIKSFFETSGYYTSHDMLNFAESVKEIDNIVYSITNEGLRGKFIQSFTITEMQSVESRLKLIELARGYKEIDDIVYGITNKDLDEFIQSFTNTEMQSIESRLKLIERAKEYKKKDEAAAQVSSNPKSYLSYLTSTLGALPSEVNSYFSSVKDCLQTHVMPHR